MEQRNCNYGIVYVAFGYDYLLMAAHSAATAKKTNPGIKCLVITNLPFDNDKVQPSSPFDYVTKIEKESKYNREIKTNIIQYTPFERTLFLDCDTEVRGSLDPAFRCLDYYDLALKMDVSPANKIYELVPSIPGKLFPIYNSGAIFFKYNDSMYKVFDLWHRILVAEERRIDQPALAQAIFQTPEARLLPLGVMWNTFKFELHLLINGLDDSIIRHYRHPHTWPQVAPALQRMHQSCCSALINPSASTIVEVDLADKRYKFLSTYFYRFCVEKLTRWLKTYELVIRVTRAFNLQLKCPNIKVGKRYQKI